MWDTNRREAEEMLIDVLKDDDWGSFFPPSKASAMAGMGLRFIGLMVLGLAYLRGNQTVPALEKLKSVVAEQMHPRIERVIEGFGNAVPSSKVNTKSEDTTSAVSVVTPSTKYQGLHLCVIL